MESSIEKATEKASISALVCMIITPNNNPSSMTLYLIRHARSQCVYDCIVLILPLKGPEWSS